MAVTLARPGQTNLSGSATANFRTIFSGEILEAFVQMNKMRALTESRTIDHGTSADFPTTGVAAAQYHTAGNAVTTQNIATGKVTIPIDGKLYSAAYLDELDDMMNHFDVRSPYARQLAQSLADAYDKNVLIEIAKGASASANLTGLSGGSVVADDTFKLSGVGTGDAASIEAKATALIAGITQMATYFDTKKVPESDRHIVFDPTTYNDLAMAVGAVNNKDYTNGASLNTLYVPPIADFTIHKSLSMPTTNISQGSAGAVTYYHYGDFSEAVGVAFHRSAVGSVMLQGLTTEMEWQIEYQAHLFLAKMAVGHKYKRPEACGLFKTVTP